MPYRRGGFSKKLRLVTINSEKHVVDNEWSTTTTNVVKVIAKAVTAPSNTVDTDCHRGGQIKAIWVSIDFCGLATSGALQKTIFYLIKNPGDNLTGPNPFSTGSSNEKKFIIRQWQFMMMRNQDGNPPFHWEGWIKIPKRYQRMGTDDTWKLEYKFSAVGGHISSQFIYKWYR